MKKKVFALLVLMVSLFSSPTWAGSYLSTGYTIDDFDFAEWASVVVDYSGYSSTTVDNILGELDKSLAVGASEGGYIIVGFDSAITDGDGVDFVIWENGFVISGTDGLVYAELGYVSVSTDGVNWVTFASVSETEASSNPYVDPSDVYNLAGNFAAYYTDVEYYEGTGFDLSDLANTDAVLNGLVDLSNINYIMITDVISGTDTDSLGNVIYDGLSYGGGADWNAIGVVNAVPVPSAIWMLASGLVGLAGLRRRS